MRTETSVSDRFPAAQSRGAAFDRAGLIEAAGMLLALLVLIHIAGPLLEPLAQQRIERRFAGESALDHRSIWLAGHLPQVLALHAALLWISIRITRGTSRPKAAVLALATAWVVALRWLSDPTVPKWAIGAAAVAVILAALPARRARGHHQAAAHPLLLPGWYFLVSLGLIWLTDYGSYVQPTRNRHLAHSQILAATAAHAVYAIAALGRGMIVSLSIRILSRIDIASANAAAPMATLGRVFAVPAAYFVWSATVAIVFGGTRPALTSELLRIPLYVLSGWVLYRWTASRTPRRAWVAGATVLLALCAGLVGTHDLGQIFLVGMATAAATSLGAVSVFQRGRFAGVCAIFIAIGATALGVQMLNDYCEANAERHFCRREASRVLLFEGPVHYKSELLWMAADTPKGGHGLTHVPYCGTLGSLAPDRYVCAGPPRELHSDYVLAALMATWGSPMALVITAFCALWLASLPAPGPRDDTAHPAHFAFWVTCAYALVSIGQLLLTALGTLGALPLTGIPFPFLALGSSSLLAAAFFCGLAANRWPAAAGR